MTSLAEKIRKEGKTLRSVARELSVNVSDVSHFINRRPHKVGKSRRKIIRLHFISQGWLPTPKPRPKCFCPHCGKVHVASNPFRSKASGATVDDDRLEGFCHPEGGVLPSSDLTQSTHRAASAQLQSLERDVAA